MILLDTHVWVWWSDGDRRLSRRHAEVIEENEDDEIGISIMSCWEVAKLWQCGRMQFLCPLNEWVEQALTYPGIVPLPLTPEIIVESVQLPGSFHRDPADQLIVATARVHGCPLLTSDEKIQQYDHVDTIA